ncbi:MAG: acetyltransferase [Elusimicrobia bacterium]|nr:MAG: acetyltransferase [Elusimicrobiota bacterium]
MPGSIIVRGESSNERAKIEGVVDDAFSDPRVRTLIRNLRKSAMFKLDLSCVADIDRVPVGYVVYFPVMIQGNGRAVKAVHMSPIAVKDVPERQGVGERLVRHGIQRAHSLGYEIVLVMGPADYFSYFGFQQASPFGIKANLPVPDDHFMVHFIRPELAETSTGVVLYPPGVLSV